MASSRKALGRAAVAIVLVVAIALQAGHPANAQQQQQEAVQNYPTKPIRLIVPWVAGGGTDIVTRIIAQKLSSNLGQPIVVDNRPGANGIIGAEIAAKSPPDGYTVVLHSVEHFINAGVYSKLPYDTLKDFSPLTLVGTHYLLLIVNPTSPAKSVNELVALAKSKPEQITFGSWGTASLSHLSGELLKIMGKVSMTHVPYKGAPQAATDVLTGRISFMFTTPPTSLPSIRASKLLAIAATSGKRLSFLPEVPTMIESGYPGFDVQSWRAMFVPANTPREIISKLHNEIVKVVQTEEVRQHLMAAGFDAVSCTPEQLSAFSRAQLAKWGKVAKEAGVHID